MANLAINYDLSKPGRDYTSLINAIKAFGSWCHPTESSWIVSTTLTAEQLLNQLLKHIDSNDKIIVSQLTGIHAWYGLDPKVAEWLKSVRV